MKNELKKKILKSLEEISNEEKRDLENMSDILNIIKIIGDYEEFESEIRDMLNKKAYRDKWKMEEK